METENQVSDPAFAAFMRRAAANARKTEQAQARKVEGRRAANAADLRSPDGPKLHPAASLADILGIPRRT